MSRSTTAVFPGRSGHNDDPYEDEEDAELTAAQKAEHARIRASINARLATLQAEAKASRSVSAVRGPRSSSAGVRLTKKQQQAASLAKRRATIAAKAAAAAAVEEDDEGEGEGEEAEAVGGAGSGPAARKATVRFFDMANTQNVTGSKGKLLIRNRNTRKSTTRKPVIPMVNMGRSQNAANISALFAKMSSLTVDKDPGYLTKVLLHMKTKPDYLDKSPFLTDKEKELLKIPGVLAKLERQAAVMDKE